MRTIVFLSLFLCIFQGHASASREKMLFSFYQANEAYRAEDYEQAISLYQSILTQGYHSPALYYNIANSYFKLGDLARAILYYERARQLIPRDADLKANYRHARSIAAVEFDTPVTAFGLGWWQKIKAFSTVSEVTLFSAMIYVLVGMLWVLAFVLKLPKKITFGASSLLFIVFSLSMTLLIQKISEQRKTAIVIEETSAKFEPHERATDHYLLYPGSKVFLVGQSASWVRVRRQDGRQGWVPESQIKTIFFNQ